MASDAVLTAWSATLGDGKNKVIWMTDYTAYWLDPSGSVWPTSEDEAKRFVVIMIQDLILGWAVSWMILYLVKLNSSDTGKQTTYVMDSRNCVISHVGRSVARRLALNNARSLRRILRWLNRPDEFLSKCSVITSADVLATLNCDQARLNDFRCSQCWSSKWSKASLMKQSRYSPLQ